MSEITREIAQMLEMLPEQDQTLAYELVKKLVLAWDPDFTKATPFEAKDMQLAEQDFAVGDVTSHQSINWN